MKQITLITGGGRSGKSTHALNILNGYNKKAFIATAIPFDDEMRERIAQHKRDRDASIFLIEEPLDLAGAVRRLHREIEITVIDCLTVWVGNLIHQQKIDKKGNTAINTFIELLNAPPCNLVIVTNEVGMGIIPDNEISRRFRDILGALNQQVASLAHQVILMVSGIPVSLKKT
jgi:adenosylcobinamide kinase/adenosylcobinamide-phosphate guanylyltransferase